MNLPRPGVLQGHLGSLGKLEQIGARLGKGHPHMGAEVEL
jgi:hypothetical protein